MIDTSLRGLGEQIAGEVSFDVPLAQFTTYRIGGNAALLIQPRTAADIAQAVTVARDGGVPWMALGLGSNVLVTDAGFPGIVIRVGKWLDDIRPREADDPVWRVGAGLPTPLLARRTADAGFAGVHRLIGVPGSVGGGVFMNAGAHRQEYRQVVQEVEIVTGEGALECLATADIPWAYRSSGLRDVVVTGTTLELVPGDARRLRVEIAEHFRWRKAGTPFTEPCCGSVFRNPAGDRTAGRLIDAVGMKGFRVGGARVSFKHANYIVNTGGASADDVLRVIDAVRSKVLEEFGIELELEVEVVGVRGGQ